MFFSGGARVVHMMLMSWAGEPAIDSDVPDLIKELECSWQDVLDKRVDQEDLRMPNTLWSRERRRVMIIDFDRAKFLPPPKHKQELGGVSKKKKRNVKDIQDTFDQKRARIG
ncbi:hypothetical protein F4860DRAFT_517844 [Xylaria cubensis]|nr:hypothetical protein F4860DRAFT_517844 [Xylaria cubensis]